MEDFEYENIKMEENNNITDINPELEDEQDNDIDIHFKMTI